VPTCPPQRGPAGVRGTVRDHDTGEPRGSPRAKVRGCGSSGLGFIEFLLKDPEVTEVTPANAPTSLLLYLVQMPGIGNALQLVLAGVLELKAAARNQVLHGLRD